jgi:hypothetical protein
MTSTIFQGGFGGAGKVSDITGSATSYGGGGGGGACGAGAGPGTGGAGGGGYGGGNNGPQPHVGAANTGGGGGGSGGYDSGSTAAATGGSGIVILSSPVPLSMSGGSTRAVYTEACNPNGISGVGWCDGDTVPRRL